jgi:dihydroxyacetone kinase-like protein
MTKSRLSVEETKNMFIFVSKAMIQKKDLLTKTDKAVGDGDHGINMARGFENVETALMKEEFSSIGQMMNKIGMILLTKVGGAVGAIFGTFFRGCRKNLEDINVLNSKIIAKILTNGLHAVKKRGGAKPGDKTMIDALEPAAIKAEELIEKPLNEALNIISKEAERGMEDTKNMIAKIGKAKTIGKRTLGHSDPGAVSMYLLLKFMAEFVNK